MKLLLRLQPGWVGKRRAQSESILKRREKAEGKGDISDFGLRISLLILKSAIGKMTKGCAGNTNARKKYGQ